MKRFLISVAAASLLMVFVENAAGAGSKPTYDLTCIVGGLTTATWRHAKLDQATFEWFTAGSTTAYVSRPVPINTRAPHGSIFTSAGTLPGVIPATLQVSFRHADGSGSDLVTVACA